MTSLRHESVFQSHSEPGQIVSIVAIRIPVAPCGVTSGGVGVTFALDVTLWVIVSFQEASAY
jgi:hypothetical protein